MAYETRNIRKRTKAQPSPNCYDTSYGERGAPNIALSLFKYFFFQRNFSTLTNGCFCSASNNTWVKMPTKYSIANDNIPFGNGYITYGPPPNSQTAGSGIPSHYFPNYPLGSVYGLLNVPYFMAGSNDYNFTIGEPDSKTWIDNSTLDWYLVNLRTLCNNYTYWNSNIQGFQVWALTDYTGNMYTSQVTYYPSCGGVPNFMSYAYWRRWDIGVYYAKQTGIPFPGYSSI